MPRPSTASASSTAAAISSPSTSGARVTAAGSRPAAGSNDGHTPTRASHRLRGPSAEGGEGSLLGAAPAHFYKSERRPEPEIAQASSTRRYAACTPRREGEP